MFLIFINSYNQELINFHKYFTLNELSVSFKTILNEKYNYSLVEKGYLSDLNADMSFFIIPNIKHDKVKDKINQVKCSPNANDYGKYRCAFIEALKNDSSIVENELELYSFVITKENIEDEPFVENVEGGAFANYYAKKNSKIRVYKYNNQGQWIFLEELVNTEGLSARIFGSRYIDKLLKERILGNRS